MIFKTFHFQGVLLFIFLVCNRPVLTRLKARLRNKPLSPEDIKVSTSCNISIFHRSTVRAFNELNFRCQNLKKQF